MNQQQRKYAVNRINDICNAKCQKLQTLQNEESNTISGYSYNVAPLYPHEREVIKALLGLESKARLRSKKDLIKELENNPPNPGRVLASHGSQLQKLCYPDNEEELKKFQDSTQTRLDIATKYQNLIKQVRTQASVATDAIILGDEQEALSAIRDFEAAALPTTSELLG